jgi:DNA polymerase-3 subunit delta'
LPHTFLFVGPAGVGRKTVALALAQAILCEKSPDACGVCGSCLRISRYVLPEVSKSASPNTVGTEALLVIEPEKNQIKIEQAHQVLEFLSLRALGKNRVVILDGAETLNPQAGNSLLKALEEPPPGTYIFMIAPSPEHVLPTLRSRAQVVTFRPLTVLEMQKKVTAPEWALKASQGSFERLSQLLEKDELAIRESALAWLQDWSQEPLAYLKSLNRDLVRGRENAQSLAHHLSWLLRDAMYLKLGASDKILNSDKLSELRKITEKISQEHLMKSCEKALWIEQNLKKNFDPSLVFEQFWIETRPEQ